MRSGDKMASAEERPVDGKLKCPVYGVHPSTKPDSDEGMKAEEDPEEGTSWPDQLLDWLQVEKNGVVIVV